VGCYADGLTPRDLSYIVNSLSHTVDSCIQACMQLKYTYAGLQNGLVNEQKSFFFNFFL
jgi:hypothetical protein